MTNKKRYQELKKEIDAHFGNRAIKVTDNNWETQLHESTDYVARKYSEYLNALTNHNILVSTTLNKRDPEGYVINFVTRKAANTP